MAVKIITRVHAKRIGHQAGVLAAGAAETDRAYSR